MDSKETYSPLPNRYAGLDDKLSELSRAKAVVLLAPLEKSTSYARGCEAGPQAIISASRYLEAYDQELDCEPCDIGIHTDFALLHSNIPLLDIEDSVSLIEEKVKEHLKAGKFVVTLGGEHTVAVGAIRAHAKFLKGDFTVVQFDAHADLRDNYQGMKYSHGCAIRRIIDDKNVVQIGIRSLSQGEAEYIKRNKLKIFWAGQKIDKKLVASILSEIKTKDIYITFDVDFLDPSVMPATGTPEPGGYGWNDTLCILRELIGKKNLVGMDFNELSPLGNGIVHPDFLVAKLIYKVLAYKYFLK